MKTSARAILLESLRDLRRVWPQMVAADLAARVLGLVILTPVVGLLLKLFLNTTAGGVLTDAAIAAFLLHPIGLLALVVVCTISLCIFFAEIGQLMVIGYGCLDNRRVTWRSAMTFASRRLPALSRLASFVVVRLLLIALPFVAAIAAASWLGTREHDINYYLAERPPEFRIAAVIAAMLVIVMAVWMASRIAGWLLALPMVLFDGFSSRAAVIASEKAMSGERRRAVGWLIAWVAAPLLVSLLVNVAAAAAAGLLIPRGSAVSTTVLAGLSALLIVGGLMHLVILVCATTLFPLFVVRLHREMVGAASPPTDLLTAGELDDGTSRVLPGKGTLAATAAALLLTAGGVYWFARTLDRPEQTLIIAHRGGAAAAPENTIAAFERGIADGAVWIELDVQEAADGSVVVFHDRDFMRLAGSPLGIHEAADADLKRLDVGSFFAPTFADQRVSTLREILGRVKGRSGLFIELKYYGQDRSLESKVVELVEEAGMTSNIVVMSLKYDGVRKTAALRPGWTYGLLNAVAIGDLTQLDVDFLALAADGVSMSLVRRAHRRGMKVYAWTINDPVQMWIMLSRGVDGLITDRVTLARQIQDARARLTPVGRFVVWMAAEAGLLRNVAKSSREDDA